MGSQQQAQKNKGAVASRFGRALWCSLIAIIVTVVLVALIAWLSANAEPGAGLRALLIIIAICFGLTFSALLFGEPLMNRLAIDLDRLFIWIDKKLNLYGPDRCSIGGLCGHSWKVTVLAALTAAVIVLGPHWWREPVLDLLPGIFPDEAEGILAFVVVLLLGFGLLAFFGWALQPIISKGWIAYRWQFLIHAIVLGLLLAIMMYVTAENVRPGEAVLYRHVMLFLLTILLPAMLVAYGMAALLFARYDATENARLLRRFVDLLCRHTKWTCDLTMRVLALLKMVLKALRVILLLPAGEEESAESAPVRIEKSDMKPLGARRSQNSEDLAIDYKRFFRSLIKAPFYHGIEILWWPSLFVVLMADPDTMTRWAFYTGIVAWAVYTVGEMHEHLAYMLGALRRALFLGGQLVVSMLVILLAAGRLFDNSYIATLISGQSVCLVEIGPISVCTSNLVLLGYITSAYIVFWYFEYWLNRILCDRLLGVFDTTGGGTPGSVPVNFRTDNGTPVSDFLQVHGASRFALLEKRDNKNELKCTFGRSKLIKQILKDGDLEGQNSEGKKHKGEQLKLILIHRARFYFFAVYLILAVPIGWAAYAYYSMPQRAELAAAGPSSKKSTPEKPNGTAANPGSEKFDLQAALFGNGSSAGCVSPKSGKRHAILVAASGGGTRAALYTYSVLRGLRQIELAEGCSALHAVILLSGVSGGSAALAYFKAHHSELLAGEPGDDAKNAWRKYRDTMAAPFFQDVLLGASEMRLLYGCKISDGKGKLTEGMRLSTMLRESFDRRFALDFVNPPGPHLFTNGCSPVATQDREPEEYTLLIGRWNSERKVGLIFNTALAGQFPVSGDTGQNTDICTFDTENNWLSELEVTKYGKRCRTSLGKGGRLVFTNLKHAREYFPSDKSGPEGAEDSFLNYVVVDDPNVPVATAGALSANFPPVFPNAAVDLGGKARYWVTDGGAADNRGIVSLLYALEGAVKQLPKEKANDRPVIHVVLADASAASPTHAQDRGIGSALGSAERFASQLMTDKYKEIRCKYENLTEDASAKNEIECKDEKTAAGTAQLIHFHNLIMPLALRSNGGVGTHWMLPDTILLRPPFGSKSEKDNTENRAVDDLADPCNPVDGQIGIFGSLWRFLSLRKVGCEVNREEILTLFDMLHAMDAGDPSAVYDHIADKKPNALKWLCEKSSGVPQHKKNWARLVGKLGGTPQTYCDSPS